MTAKPKNTPKICAKSAAVPETKTLDCYARLVSEIATLECVQATLSEWELAGQPTGHDCHVGSAELVLCQLIRRLNELAGDVENMQDRLEKAAPAVGS
jgi:hypothetical protein